MTGFIMNSISAIPYFQTGGNKKQVIRVGLTMHVPTNIESFRMRIQSICEQKELRRKATLRLVPDSSSAVSGHPNYNIVTLSAHKIPISEFSAFEQFDFMYYCDIQYNQYKEKFKMEDYYKSIAINRVCSHEWNIDEELRRLQVSSKCEQKVSRIYGQSFNNDSFLLYLK